MSLLYPRLIEVRRLKTNSDDQNAVGLAGYSGAEQSTTSAQGGTVMFTGVAASIQAGTTGRKRDSALPQDAVFAPTWDIFIPLSGLAKGSVRDRDFIVDDEGYRYEVSQNYWNILGYKLTCIREEA